MGQAGDDAGHAEIRHPAAEIGLPAIGASLVAACGQCLRSDHHRSSRLSPVLTYPVAAERVAASGYSKDKGGMRRRPGDTAQHPVQRRAAQVGEAAQYADVRHLATEFGLPTPESALEPAQCKCPTAERRRSRCKDSSSVTCGWCTPENYLPSELRWCRRMRSVARQGSKCHG